MSEKPIYNPHDIGPVCAQCGVNYLKKHPFSNRCPSCRGPLLIWVTVGVVIGLALGWLAGRDVPQAGQVAIAAATVAMAVGLGL